ncbi:MAG: hypothetical protein ACFCUI_06870 [Bernardetiaceae bacterium]
MKKHIFSLTLTFLGIFLAFQTNAQSRTPKSDEIRAYVKAQRATYTEVPAVIEDKSDYFVQLLTEEFPTLTERDQSQIKIMSRRYYTKVFAINDVKNAFRADYDQLMSGTGRGYDQARATYQERVSELDKELDAHLLYFLKRDNFAGYQRIKGNIYQAVIDRYGE